MNTKKKRRVEFKFPGAGAQQVLLAGSFNHWSETSDPMKKDGTGQWKKIKFLPAGEYEYKFLVDGVWTLDPGCPAVMANRFGTENNVLSLSEPAQKKKKLK